LFASLTNYIHQQQPSVTDAPPKSSSADDTTSPRENTVTSSDDSAMSSGGIISALLSPLTSQKQSLSFSLFINRGKDIFVWTVGPRHSVNRFDCTT